MTRVNFKKCPTYKIINLDIASVAGHLCGLGPDYKIEITKSNR